MYYAIYHGKAITSYEVKCRLLKKSMSLSLASFYCPKCQKEVEYLEPQNKNPYFRHKYKGKPSTNESPWHQKAKKEITRQLKGKVQNLIMERATNDADRRSDVYVEYNGQFFSLELQASRLSKKEISEREKDYQKESIRVLWLLHPDKSYHQINEKNISLLSSYFLKTKDHRYFLPYWQEEKKKVKLVEISDPFQIKTEFEMDIFSYLRLFKMKALDRLPKKEKKKMEKRKTPRRIDQMLHSPTKAEKEVLNWLYVHHFYLQKLPKEKLQDRRLLLGIEEPAYILQIYFYFEESIEKWMSQLHFRFEEWTIEEKRSYLLKMLKNIDSDFKSV